MRINSIAAMRTLAILGIITIHAGPFTNFFFPELWAEPRYVWLSGLLNQLSRFAVPLFFLFAGYFIAPKLTDRPLGTAWRYCRPLLTLWLVWSLIYLVIPFNWLSLPEQGYLAERWSYWQTLLANPLNSLFEGGIVHLWFLPALICCTFLTALLLQLGWQRALLPLALLAYAIGLLGGSYAPTPLGFETDFITRNGPFFGWLPFALGMLLHRGDFRLGTGPALALTLLGMGIHFLEAFMLLHHYQIPLARHDFLIGTPLWATGLFTLLLNFPAWGKDGKLERWSELVLGIYLLHLLFVIWLMPLSVMLHSIWWELVKVPLIFALTLLTIRGIQKLPKHQWLLR